MNRTEPFSLHPPAPGLAASLLLPVLSACGSSHHTSPKDAGERPPNLLLITIDTLRADHLGCYGYEAPTSPALDRLAARSTVFERAYATSSWTLPSLVSLMTGHYAQTHGCNFNGSPLALSFDTLAERLQRAGFETAAVASHFYLASRFGLDQGFELYDEELVVEDTKQSARTITSEGLTNRSLDWLEPRIGREDGRPWFLWVHYFDPHHHYLPHEQFAGTFPQEPASESFDGDVQVLVDLYDGEIAFTDRQIGRLLERLEQQGAMANTVVVVTADHGEEFRDHGGLFHRKTLYEEVVRVPLIVHVPGCEARRIEQVVSGVDLLPTMLDLSGVALEGKPVAGRSLTPLLWGESMEASARLTQVVNRQRDVAAVVEGDWKLVCDRLSDRSELYHLASDPSESADLAAVQRERVQAMRERMEAIIERALKAQRPHRKARRLKLSEDDLRALDELGYGGED